jgi:HAD superfamily hydrolase (TIGR01549 family)
MSNQYKGLMIDLDDTLIRSASVYDKSTLHTAKYVSSKYNIDEKAFFNCVMDKYAIISRTFPTTHTRHSRILVYRAALETIGIEYDLSILPELEEMYWSHFLENVTVYDNVYETLSTLKDNGVKIAIVSDGDLSLRIRKAQATDLLKYIDEMIASEEVIFEKPFSAIFTLSLSRLGLEPHQAIMLGNNYKNDIRGAQLLGIRSGMFNPPVDGNPIGQDNQSLIVPDFVINDFVELLEEFGIK